MVWQKERPKRTLWNKYYDLIRQIRSAWIYLWIFLLFMRHLYWMSQYLCMQELWHNALEFVSSSLTLATQYPTQSLSRVIQSRCSSEIVNVIYIWFVDLFFILKFTIYFWVSFEIIKLSIHSINCFLTISADPLIYDVLIKENLTERIMYYTEIVQQRNSK